MKVAVIVPDEYMGDVIGDINCPPRSDPGYGTPQRRHRRSTRSFRWPRCSATPPTCAPSTQGRGQYTMEPSHYEELPKSMQRGDHRQARKSRA